MTIPLPFATDDAFEPYMDGHVVYLVQLEPTLDPKRLKVGYTQMLRRRLRAFRALCPQARIVRAAIGDRVLEARLLVAFDCDFERIVGEVFRARLKVATQLFNKVTQEAAV